MYISLLILDVNNRYNRSLLSDIYKQHQFVMKGFGDNISNQDKESILFRLEPEKDQIVFIIKSKIKPIWSNDSFSSEIKAYSPSINNKDILNFRIRVNATKTLSKNNSNNAGKRIGIAKLEDFEQWLKRKADENGLELLETVCSNEGHLIGKKADRDVRVQSWLVNGRCKVVDIELFSNIIDRGIGKCKSMGFGLFSIARS